MNESKTFYVKRYTGGSTHTVEFGPTKDMSNVFNSLLNSVELEDEFGRYVVERVFKQEYSHLLGRYL